MNEVAKLESAGEALLHKAGSAVPELFIINLCASMTPMPAVPRNLKGFEKHKLYQVSRQEDGRRRFRLRLGFFTSEADAEWVLNSVRNLYPTAFASCVTQEDLRYFGETAPVASLPALAAAPGEAAAQKPIVAQQPAVVAAATAHRIPTPIQASVIKPAAPPMATAAKQTLTIEAPQALAPEPEKNSNAQPFHVARGVEIPETHLELTDEYAILSVPAVAPAAAQTSATARSKIAPAIAPANTGAPATTATNGPVRSATFISPPKVVDDYVPILDTTLTIRTLTSTEAEDPNRPKWFAVQLALSEQPINLDTMPKLDIFAAYTLYSVAMMEGGTIKHALRLGFFRENVSAEAVMGYLKAFFSMPAITQIATAEYERFAESRAKPQASPAAEAKVVKLDGKRPVVPAKPAMPIVGTSTPANRPVATTKPKDTKTRSTSPPPRPQSFLSRLIGRQLD